ncbi:MAG: hypothetical protein RLZZ519_503 [Bacteroidota bacterium]
MERKRRKPQLISSAMNSTKHMLRILGLAVLLLGIMPSTKAFVAVPPPQNDYQERGFDQDKLKEYRENAKYQYHRDKPEPPKRKAKPREKRKYVDTQPVYRDSPRTDFSGALKGVFWVLIIGAAIFVLFQLLKINFKGLLKKKSDKAKVVKETEIPVEEDITKMEFEDLLQQAVDAGRYRVAVRLLYLRTLRQLTDQGLIHWKPEKTNHDYLRELTDKRLRPGFSDVTLIFEYIWYGEFPVNKDDFNLARASFIQFEQSLRQPHAV